MNLYGRILCLIFNLLRMKPAFQPFKPVRSSFRVWFHDLDVNIHLTASRYLAFGDLGRIYWLAQNGLLGSFFSRGYRAVINAQEITYIREFLPLSRVELIVELKSWDEKYGYFEQRYYCAKQLYAVAHSRMAMIQKRKVCSFGEVFENLGHSVHSPEEPQVVTEWKQTLNAKKTQFSPAERETA